MGSLDLFRLDDKVALVTGCRRGIGLAMALGLAEAGADIIGVSKSLEREGSDVERAVRERGRRFWGYQCDFGNRAAVYEFLAEVKKPTPSSTFSSTTRGRSCGSPPPNTAMRIGTR